MMISSSLSTLNTSSFVHAFLIVFVCLRHYNQAAQLWFLWHPALHLAGALAKVWGSCDGRLPNPQQVLCCVAQ